MTRQAIPLTIPDISLFAKALRAQLPGETGHQSMLNAVARAAGYPNFQALSAAPREPEPDRRAVDRAAAWFDADGHFTAWPAKYSVQMLCLWPIWAQLPAREAMTERQISDRIHALCTFRDAARIRREMVNHEMLRRRLDGSEYRRVEQKPGPTERALIARILA
ncbi:DUF2087 domain-containing protein [Histidinibacterium aquaticum]|uniref:DUF2087 domain-containing protein n=1 Tax=Histidinibacterium aquaticum TaxID=2613962 RepID=A0A5J5GMU2_9RHOB|nr:DUF2087 domain-containing protein [Histidinibacterium aquaticum]KAA9009013.1 DUF2087 domain-containing protein [Histidinibacterium aquaticum]